MILEALSLGWLLGVARAEPVVGDDVDEVGADEALDAEDVLSRYRQPFDVLANRAIGTTSRPVAFDWRRTDVQVAIQGSYLAELNNFNSMSAGAIVRLPSRSAVVEIGARWTEVWDSRSSEILAFTPYRQPGRPDRVDLDFSLALPLAEGIVTPATRFVPAAQMVFNAYGGLRYALYPTGFRGMTPGRIGRALLAPQLTDEELANLEGARLDAMKLDRGRYALTLGLGNDLYFASGFFLSPRVQVAVPLLAPATGSELWMWADLSVAAGFAW